MHQTTEVDDPRSERRGGAGRRALVMVFPAAAALDLPRNSQAAGRAWLDAAGFGDSKVSNDHVRFNTQGPSVSVEDLGSRNGTFVDGSRLDPGDVCTLFDRAVIRIGGTVLVYRESFSGPNAPDPPTGGLVGPFGLRSLAAEVERMQAIIGDASRPILVTGETGTGKELLAQELAQRLRRRPAEPFLVTATPPHLFDSMLFGHARGSFSGADRDYDGVLKRNAAGAVLLDEIGDLPADEQPKLLRFLDSGEIQPLGKRPERVSVLVIAATNRFDLLEREDRFRPDLLARFSWRLKLSPLRERREDIFAIADALATRIAGRGYARDTVDPRAIEQLLLHPWDRGNSRELRRCVELAATRASPPQLPNRAVSEALAELGAPRQAWPVTSLSRARARQALEAAGGNQSKAAETLGINLPQLRRKLEK